MFVHVHDSMSGVTFMKRNSDESLTDVLISNYICSLFQNHPQRYEQLYSVIAIILTLQRKIRSFEQDSNSHLWAGPLLYHWAME